MDEILKSNHSNESIIGITLFSMICEVLVHFCKRDKDTAVGGGGLLCPLAWICFTVEPCSNPRPRFALLYSTLLYSTLLLQYKCTLLAYRDISLSLSFKNTFLLVIVSQCNLNRQ